MDERYIDTLKKLQRAVVWTAYSRREKRIIAYEISNKGISSCLGIYKNVKEKVSKVLNFYSDGNSCYEQTYLKYLQEDKLTIANAETHLIESSHSSFRYDLKRFSRRTKDIAKH